MKSLLDDNDYVKKWFESKGSEAIKLIEIGLKGADDEDIYIITLDLDFGYLFLKFQRGTVIVLRSQRATPIEIIKLLEK